jgi:hypothetical protein
LHGPADLRPTSTVTVTNEVAVHDRVGERFHVENVQGHPPHVSQAPGAFVFELRDRLEKVEKSPCGFGGPLVAHLDEQRDEGRVGALQEVGTRLLGQVAA